MTPRTSGELSIAQFDHIARFAHQNVGIVLDQGKRSMVQSRLAKRLRRLGLSDFTSYFDLIKGRNAAPERRELIALLTTNVTGFFREPHHFEQLRDKVLPPLIDRLVAGGRVRMWSAGCSYGNEAYSIAMICAEALAGRADLDLRILATDIDMHVLEAARAGVFEAQITNGLPPDLKTKYMTCGADGKTWRVVPKVRNLVAFRELNLIDDWPMQGKFDVVFCRNVVIYFDAELQKRLCLRLADAIPAGGWLCIGHSERIAAAAQKYFHSDGITAFRRTTD